MKLVLQTKIGRHVTRLSEQDSNHGWLRSVFQPFVVEDLDEPSVAVGHFSSSDGPAWYFDANELPPFIWLFCRCCWCFASTEEKLIHELIFQKFNFQKTPASPASRSHSRSLWLATRSAYFSRLCLCICICGLHPAQPSIPIFHALPLLEFYLTPGTLRAMLPAMLPAMHTSVFTSGSVPEFNHVASPQRSLSLTMRLTLQSLVNSPCVMIISALEWALLLTTTTQRSKLP